jgi:hypothetical protein
MSARAFSASQRFATASEVDTLLASLDGATKKAKQQVKYSK